MPRKPIAITLDAHVESLMDHVEKLLTALGERQPYDYDYSEAAAIDAAIDATESKLREVRRLWLAEQTARAR